MKRMLPNLGKSFGGKQLALVALLVGASFTQVLAQTYTEYQSKKTGNWNVPATWEKREVVNGVAGTWGSLLANERPTFSSGPIKILDTHAVTVTATETVDQLTIDEGGSLVINYPVPFYVNDGAGTDMLVNGTVIGLGRGGENLGNIYTTVSSADITFAARSVYKHEYQPNPDNAGKTAWGIIPTANWDISSTVEINVNGATVSTLDIPAAFNINQNFGNVVWNTPLLSGNISLDSKLTNIQGSFEVVSTGTSQLVLNPATSNNYSLTIGQDLKILNDSKVVFAAGLNNTDPNNFNLNIGRSFILNSAASFSNSRPVALIQVTFTGTDGILSVPKTLSKMNFEVAPGASIKLGNNFAIPSPYLFDVYGTINTEAYSLFGGGTFKLNGGGAFGVGSPLGLNGNISVTTRDFSPNSTFIYNGAYSQATGAMLPSTVGSLVIDNAGNSVEMTNSIFITNSLSLQNGTLKTLSKILTFIESAGLTVTSANNSYVDGTVRYEVGTGGSKNMIFPLGKNNVYTPIKLELVQSAGFSNYTATQTESGLTITSFPTDVDKVSSKRYYTINKSGAATVTNAFVTLAYNADEILASTEPRILKSVGNSSTYEDLGGAVTLNTIKSKVAFTTFSNFAIGYKTIAPLPVELISFKAEKAENAVNVRWTTASEKDNAYFAVERSADGKNFVAIGQVEGNGSSNTTKDYAFVDKNPLNNISYYRLKQVDLDGAFEYSQIVKVQVANRNVALSLNAFPNPTADKVNVQIAGLNEAASLQVFDLAGRMVTSQNIEKGAAQVEVNLAKYPAGMYQVKLVSAAGTTFVKVIKN